MDLADLGIGTLMDSSYIKFTGLNKFHVDNYL